MPSVHNEKTNDFITQGAMIMKRQVLTVLLIIVLGVALAAPASAATERPWATIGTGSLTGVYYSTGHAIAKTIDRHAPVDIKMTVEETAGSLENLEAVTSGEIFFGLVQSDIQYKAWNGTPAGPWDGRPQKNLRAVCSLYTEAVNLLALSSLNINSGKDLKSRPFRINLGEPGSGAYVNATEILSAVGIDPQQDLREVLVSPPEALHMFQRSKIDAFFFTAGHPNAQFHEVAASKRQASFVPLNPEDAILENYPYYTRAMIPMKYYPGMGNKEDVPTIGVRATVVASTDTPDWMVYGVVKALVENMDYFKTQLLVFQNLNRSRLLENLSAPLHPGALKYYREAGMAP
jgi:TRAP transporter TAXI family solute receptor